MLLWIPVLFIKMWLCLCRICILPLAIESLFNRGRGSKKSPKCDDVYAYFESVLWRKYSHGKQCSDVLHIDESSWNTASVFKTVGNWACTAFYCFLWKYDASILGGETGRYWWFFIFFYCYYYYFCAKSAVQRRPIETSSGLTLQGFFYLKEVMVGKLKGGGRSARMITAATRIKAAMMMMVIMARHRSSGGLEEIAGSLDSSHTSFFFMSLPLNCALSLQFFFCI